MRRRSRWIGLGSVVMAATCWLAPARSASTVVLGWNDLGMHCLDSDFSVFAILPPYNTVHAQVISQGVLVKSTNITVTYEAVPDTSGSLNTTSAGKINFWEFAPRLFGASLAPDTGLAGFAMPGTNNTPQAMSFQGDVDWFSATGIPITPQDDAGLTNTYPMMRLVARGPGGVALAQADVVLPVSTEMDCRVCHASGANPQAMPGGQYVWDCDPVRDFKLNILRVHDQLNLGTDTYSSALAAAGYRTNGLFATVVQQATPILCARCHASNALPGTGVPGVMPLTQAMHQWHAYVTDPATGDMLDDVANRATCYRCHPGAETRCLRGVMGAATAPDGTLAMQCQSCHGSMMQVGDPGRRGWLDEPSCQNCHTGTATRNNGQLRYTSAFETNGVLRVPVDTTFATSPNTPTDGASLYRFSSGHGGLACEACHGSTHAEFPTSHTNDNVLSVGIQGHVGVLGECSACHTTPPPPGLNGPHGMHPTGAAWLHAHEDFGENSAACAPCHGIDFRGTVLSRTFGARTLSAFGTKNWFQGFQVGCYSCHNGPQGGDDGRGGSPNPPATVADAAATGTADTPIALTLKRTDSGTNPLQFRIASPPRHGTAGVNGTTATYIPEPNYVGTDTFRFTAWNGESDSNLGTVTVQVDAGPPLLTLAAWAPDTLLDGAAAPFRATAALAGGDADVIYDWDFGDGAPHSAAAEVCHQYVGTGRYTWTATVTARGATQTVTGTVSIGQPALTLAFGPPPAGGSAALTLTWPDAATAYVLESAGDPAADAWAPATALPVADPANGLLTVTLPLHEAHQFFRLRK